MLKQTQIQPGHVYKTDTGVEYLYLGHLQIYVGCRFRKPNQPSKIIDILLTDPMYCYVQMRDHNNLPKLPCDMYELAGNSASLDDFINKHIEILRQLWSINISKTEKPKRFKQEVCALFDGQEISNVMRKSTEKPQSDNTPPEDTILETALHQIFTA